MTPGLHPSQIRTARQPPTGSKSIVSGLAVVLATVALLAVASYPGYAMALVAVIAVAVALAKSVSRLDR